MTNEEIFDKVRKIIVEQLGVSLEQVKNVWSKFPNLVYSEKVVTPKEVSGKEETFICRLRADVEDPKIIHYFVTFDNLLKGAAMNGRQIVELLLERKKKRKN